MAIILKTRNDTCWKPLKKKGNPHSLWMGM